MTDYIHIDTKKRNFVVRVTLPNLSQTLQSIARVDDVRIARNSDTRITRNGDTRIARNWTTGYPRSIRTRKRNLTVRAKVG